VTLYLSNLLTLALLPVGLAVLLGLLALVMAAIGRRRAALLLFAAQVGLLWLSASPWTATHLMLWLEGDYPPVALEETPIADVVVVLGGAVKQVGEPAVENLTSASGRVLRAARLYRAGKVDAVLAVGGNLSWSGYRIPESALMRDLLVEWGVPKEAILLETRSQNTHENAVFAAEILTSQDWNRVLLVTSASHMARAVGAFRAAGIDVIPSPTDYAVRPATPIATPIAEQKTLRDNSDHEQAARSDGAVSSERRIDDSDGPTVGISSFLPTVEALQRTTTVIREVLGRTYYRLRGWI
jgi:uncharacterized SAM-binding protein YcdF (DUF218 family)